MARSDTFVRAAATASAGWLVSLPLLGGGMACFWLQRDAEGAARLGFALGALVLLACALVLPGLVCAFRGGARGVGAWIAAVGKSLAVAAVALVAASLLSAIKSLRPEEVSFFAQEFASAHAIAAAVPSVAAAGFGVFVAWRDRSDRWILWSAGAVVIGVLGVLIWQWSAGVAYDAIRFTNADEIVLMAQTVSLAGLLFASLVDAALCRR